MTSERTSDPQSRQGGTVGDLPQTSLYDYLAVIKRHIWWGVAGFMVTLAVLAVYASFWNKPFYQATAVIEIEAPYSVFDPAGQSAAPKVETHIQLIKNQEVLFEAMQELGLITGTISPSERERRINQFAESLTFSKVAGTPLLEINYTHPDATQAARIVNTIVKVYLTKLLGDKTNKNSARSAFIEKQLYQVTKQLNELDAKLQEMKVGGQDMKKTEILTDKLARLELDRINQSSKLGAMHPSVLALEEEMAELKKQMKQLSPNDLIYLGILREKKLNENLYDLLNTSLKETQIQSADKTVPVRVVSHALVPGQPANLDKKTDLILGILLSLFGGLALIFLRQSLDLSLDTPERVEEYLKMPVLVTIPRSKKLARIRQARLTAVGQASNSAEEQEIMERLRHLETKIPTGGNGATTLTLVSATKGVGKTTLITYYSLASAQDGKKVLIVDADLRNPFLHKKFNLANSPGLVDILNDDVALNTVIQHIPLPFGGDPTGTGKDNILDFIPSGRHTDSPMKLFSSSRLDNFLSAVKKSYDLILIDCPALLMVPEALMLCRKIDGYIFIHTPSRLDRYILGRFKSQVMPEMKDKCCGVILNNCRYPDAGYYYDYYYKSV